MPAASCRPVSTASRWPRRWRCRWPASGRPRHPAASTTPALDEKKPQAKLGVFLCRRTTGLELVVAGQVELTTDRIGITTIVTDLVTTTGVLQRQRMIAVKQVFDAGGQTKSAEVIFTLPIEGRVRRRLQTSESGRGTFGTISVREEHRGAHVVGLVMVARFIVRGQAVGERAIFQAQGQIALD